MFKKSFGLQRKNYQIVSSLSLFGGGGQENSTVFIGDYVRSSPVFIATKLIADAIAGIPIVLEDARTNKLIYDHKALKLLRNPSPFTKGNLLMKELASFYVLTGNAYVKIIGSGEPVELAALNPKGIKITANTYDGYPETYEYNSNSETRTVTYTRDAAKKFVDPMRNEVAHLRDFNPEYSNGNLIGYSMFTGCVLEIIQGIAANVHNNALLKNQARPSGLLTFSGDEVLDDEQVDEIEGILKEKLSGASNAGKTTFLNGKFNWTQLSESMKDMDFPTLKKSAAEVIFKAAKIPLAMISPDNMSFANMDASKYAFYDNAVLPVFKEILAFLDSSVLSKFKGTENLRFTFDESAIESLQLRKLEYATKLFQSGLGTRNEGRTQIGYEPATIDGDAYYSTAAKINFGDPNAAKSTPKAEYIKLMTNLKGIDGKRLYSDELVLENLKIYYNDKDE